jgi:pimeloyl-ACP methyl ester carboxylesterase
MTSEHTSWPEARTVHTHLGELEYRDIGPNPTGPDGASAPVLLFVHLVLAAGDHWDKVVDLLSDRYRCIVPDMPMGGHRVPASEGADLSTPGMARALAELMETLDLDDVTMIGNDTGGAICQVVGANHPERVGRIVLTDCDMYDEFPPKLFLSIPLAAAVPGGVRALAQILRVRTLWRLPITFGWLTNDVDGAKVERWAAALRADPAIARDARAAIRGMSTDHTNAAAEALRTAGIPLLIVWGADDKAFSRKNAERMRDEVPGAELVLVDDAKAFVCWDQPERLAELIDGFVSP